MKEADSEQKADVAADLGHEGEERVEVPLLADHDPRREVVEDLTIGLALRQELVILGTHSPDENLGKRET